MNLPAFSIRRRVTVAMIFASIAVVGLVSFWRLPIDLFPEIEPPVISVITYYPGASAADVEQKVTDVIEQRLSIIPNLDELSSKSTENLSLVQLKFGWGTNLDEASNDIRTQVDFAKRFLPDDVENPMLFRMNLAMFPVLMFSVSTDEGDVQELGDFVDEQIVDQIQRIEGVASVVSFNKRDQQLLVEVNRSRLEAYNLSFQQVGGAIRANNLTLPAGTLDIGRNSYTLRAPCEYQTPSDLEQVIVGQHAGSFVYLKDVADIRQDFEEVKSVALVGGSPALLLMVQRESGANTVDVAARASKRIEELSEIMPKGVHVASIMDTSQFIVQMIDILTEAVFWGGFLVILVVFFFLRRWRSSLIVALSIPTSLIGVFAMLATVGYTINMITLSAMAIAVGMVVDDSVVVIDNIIRHVEKGKSPGQAAAEGAAEVSNAVMAATMTTIAIFAPVLLVGGMIGVMFTELSFVVIVAMTISLLAALMLVPVLSERLIRKSSTSARENRLGRVARFSELQMGRLEAAYGRLIGWALDNRIKVVVITIGLFLSSLSLTGTVGMDFMPQSDGGMLQIQFDLAEGTRVEHTEQIARQVQEIVERKIPEAEMLFLQAGSSKSGMGAATGRRQGPNIGMVGCRVPRRSERNRSTFEMVEEIRPEIEQIPGIISLQMDGSNPLTQVASGGNKPITVEVFSDSIADARNAIRQIKAIMERTSGTRDVVTDLLDDRPELKVSVDRKRAALLGVPMASVAMSVRTAMYGDMVTRYRGGNEDIDVFLRLREVDRATVADVERLTVPSMSGAQVRLDNFASITESSTPIEIGRVDQQRMLRAMANVSGRALSDVANDVEMAIAADQQAGKIPASVSTRFAGDVKEQRSMAIDLTIALLLSILLVYMVMAAQFESLLDPLVIIFSVPFGVTGVFLALVLTRTTLSITAFIGMIMLVGIVVKNAIVLVDYINVMRDQGMGMREALITGGERRLRPVLMTAVTTIGGMLPLALATGEGSENWKPMGVAVIGGLLVSTLVTLVLIPCVYAMTNKWRKRGRETDRALAMEAAEIQHGAGAA